MEKYRNKYRIKSNRLQNWDYGWSGHYFVTICTAKKSRYFGDIDGQKNIVVLSEIGEIAYKCWMEIPQRFPFVQLKEFVVMPNHVHGILVLSGNKNFDDQKNNVNDDTYVETRHALSLRTNPYPNPRLQSQSQTVGVKRFQNQGQNTLSSIIGSYKSAVTRYAHRSGFYFFWQSRFYDHVIRNDESLLSIQDYIKNNPLKWIYDKYYEE